MDAGLCGHALLGDRVTHRIGDHRYGRRSVGNVIYFVTPSASRTTHTPTVRRSLLISSEVCFASRARILSSSGGFSLRKLATDDSCCSHFNLPDGGFNVSSSTRRRSSLDSHVNSL